MLPKPARRSAGGRRGIWAGGLRRAFLGLALLAWPPWGEAGAAVIRADTVWQGIVELEADCTVAQEATLLVLPGTVVRVARRWNEAEGRGVLLDIRGRLIAQGREDRPIFFTSAGGEPRAGDWAGIVFTRAGSRLSVLSHCTIEYADAAVQGGASRVLLEHCRLRRNRAGLAAFEEFAARLVACEVAGNEKGLYIEGTSRARVEQCRITDSTAAGVEVKHGAEPEILSSRIEGNGPAGIVCTLGAAPKIEGNVIRGHDRGIFVELMSHPLIRHNEIAGNETGIWAEKQVSPLVQRNIITGNGVGIYCNLAARPRIEGNDIFGNRLFALVLGDNQSLAAERLLPSRLPGQQPRSGPLAGRLAPAPFDSLGAEGPVVDARGNWWGAAGSDELGAMAPEGNVSFFEDGADKPTVDFLGAGGERTGARYPRDRVAFVPWRESPAVGERRQAAPVPSVQGRLTFRGEPVAGARVYAFAAGSGAVTGEEVALSPPSGPDGSFSLHLAPGSYVVLARRTSSPFPAAETGPGDLVSPKQTLSVETQRVSALDLTLSGEETP
ncbi:MAG: right-handed parallel beta-helix repeat-containing protein [Thermodesulfobacteriota bacterium]